MTASDFILGTGGFAKIGGDIPEAERGPLNAAVKLFIDKVGTRGLQLQVPVT